MSKSLKPLYHPASPKPHQAADSTAPCDRCDLQRMPGFHLYDEGKRIAVFVHLLDAEVFVSECGHPKMFIMDCRLKGAGPDAAREYLRARLAREIKNGRTS